MKNILLITACLVFSITLFGQSNAVFSPKTNADPAIEIQNVFGNKSTFMRTSALGNFVISNGTYPGLSRFRINGQTGFVGIGVAAKAKLHVKSVGEALRLDGSTTWISFYEGTEYRGYLAYSGNHLHLINRKEGRIYLGTNRAKHVTINRIGRVGIGTQNPAARLDVSVKGLGGMIVRGNGQGDVRYMLNNKGGTHYIFDDASQNNSLNIQSANNLNFSAGGAFKRITINGTTGQVTVSNNLRINGLLRLGQTNQLSNGGSNQIATNAIIRPATDGTIDLGMASFRFEDVYATNGTIQTSDARLKKNVRTLKYGLKQVLQLTPVSFQWNSGIDQESVKIGLIAQEVLKIIPEVVKAHDYVISEDSDSPVKRQNEVMGMNYGELTAVLINAIKEQQQIIDEQNKKIDQLISRVNDLEAH